MHHSKTKSSTHGWTFRWLNGVLLLAALTASTVAQNSPPDLANASLEDLLNLEVTSVSKKEEKLFQTAAAVYVITQEEIRRSGLTSIPELLRLAPGLQVARYHQAYARDTRGTCYRRRRL
jgi:iron complex outermembrane receptor protein